MLYLEPIRKIYCMNKRGRGREEKESRPYKRKKN